MDCKYNKKFIYSPYAVNGIFILPDGNYSLVHFFSHEPYNVGEKYKIMAEFGVQNNTNTKLRRVFKLAKG